MLSRLRIRNLALVDDLEWCPGPGFVAVTGETGAGKSIILGALKLLLGERADKTLIRSGQDTCTVEAEFQIPRELQLNPLLIEQGVEPCVDGALILKRTINVATPGRQFINGSATTLNVLKWVGDALVDLHGPHDHQSLFSTERQLELLDAYARAAQERAACERAWETLQKLHKERADLEGDGGSIERTLDLLEHQINEIRSLDLLPGPDEDALLAEYTRASNSRRLTELATATVNALEESDDSILSRLAETQRHMNELEKLDPDAAALAEEHRSTVVAVEELASALRDYAERLDLDPQRITELEDKVALLETLKRKYGGTLKSAHEFAETAEVRLKRLQNRAVEVERIDLDIASARSEYDQAAKSLTEKRHRAAPELAAAVSSHLRDLGFKKSEFNIHLHAAPAPRSSGLETVEFEFAPNPGEPAKPLRSIASSGEISRVMLALKTALAREDSIALMVFDEIDANVGGEIAVAVAGKMKQLGQSHQVLAITHLPQVASRAARHFQVAKEFDGSRTTSRITEVVGDDRVRELARMLGGQTDSALSHARALISEAS